MVDAEQLTGLLAGSILDGREVETLEFDRLLVRIEPEQVWPAWQAARAVVADSRRWPVVHASTGGTAGLREVLPNPPDAGVAVTTALGMDPSTAWHKTWRDMPLTDTWAELLVTGYGLTAAEARGFIARGALLDDVEYLRLQRRLAEVGGDPARIPVSARLTDRDLLWYTPSHDDVGIIFMTSPSPVEALADVDYFGGSGAPLVAVGRSWHDRYGAELVAAWGTVLQFVTRRRPTTVTDAWELAGQQLRMAANLEIDRDDLALALLRTDFWFFHERP